MRGGFNKSFVEFFQTVLFKFISAIFVVGYTLELNFYPIYLLNILEFLKNHSNMQYKSLVELGVVDYPSKGYRFEVVYNLLSLQHSSRLKVRVKVEDVLPTCSFLFKSGNWSEREAWDMFGIVFTNHPDLRRILNDYGFSGFPLRKDYPLVGFNEVFFDDSKSSIVYEKTALAQEYRNFSQSTGF